MSELPRIVLLVPALYEGGGVPVVGAFLYRALLDSGRYQPSFVSMATWTRDPTSIRLIAPTSWRGVRTSEGTWEGLPYTHVGASFVEFEFQRYRPRRVLTRLLDEGAVVQVVAGAPAWALPASRTRRPVALQVATRVREERRALLTSARGPVGMWRRLMTQVTARMEVRALRHLDAVFVENRWMLDWLQRHMPADRIHFAPPGVDTDRFRPATSPAGGDSYILSVGRFADPRKRVDLLFRAYHELRKRRPEAPPLVLAGSSRPTADDWALVTSLGIAEHVDFRENVPSERLGDLYREASIFVLSSDEEGLGLVILEAMASGVPVVSTDCGGPSTSVADGDVGFLVPCGDAEALASRMDELLQDDAVRREMGERARRVAVERFSLDATARPFIEYYDRRLNGG